MAKRMGIQLFVYLALLVFAGPVAYAQTSALPQASDSFAAPRSAAPHSRPLVADYRSAQAPQYRVTSAIREASEATGVDYEYLVAKAQIESRLDPDAKARSSTATGLFQFIEGTWLRGLSIYAEEYALDARLELRLGDETSSDIDAAPYSREQLLELRRDPMLAALLAAAYTKDHADKLRAVLGRDASHAELYLAHFLGSGGASKFLRAWQRNPHRAAAPLFHQAARSNRSIFYTRGGKARSLAGVLRLIDGKVKIASKSALGGPPERASEHVCEFSFSSILQRNSCKTEESTLGLRVRTLDPSSAIADLGNKGDFPYVVQSVEGIFEYFFQASGAAISEPTPYRRPTATEPRPGWPKFRPGAMPCNHIGMCYLDGMSTSTITRVRDLIASGEYTKAGIARAAGLHANTLRDASEPDWNPTSETLTKLQAFIDANDDRPVLVGIEEIIDEARNGRMYILVDDEDRENEGDLIIPAQMATPAAVNFMATHGRGLICLALDKSRVDQLGLDPMSRNNKESMQTAFTVSIEAKEGVTTGISAADRARTVSVAIDATKGPDDIVTPGHVFPLMARDGGTLVRAGHTEAAVDISRLAGLNPSGVICEIMNEDGTMARLDDLIEFARKHELKIGTIRDLIAYRMRNDHLVERVDERAFESDYGGQWRMITYRNTVSDNEAYVLQKGHVVPGEPTLARVHPISVFDDVLGAPGPRKRTLQRAMGAIGDHGSGVIVILTQRVGSSNEWSKNEQDRNIGIGSQILADLGINEMILLSNSRPDLVALDGYGITITDHQPIPE